MISKQKRWQSGPICHVSVTSRAFFFICVETTHEYRDSQSTSPYDSQYGMITIMIQQSGDYDDICVTVEGWAPLTWQNAKMMY